MRAAIVERFGEHPRITDLDEPASAPGMALIRVLAAAVNPLDVAIAAGRHYAPAPALPYVPGSEGVGTVVRSGSFPQGTRVRFESRPGGGGSGALAEVTLAAEETLVELPADAGDEVAAAVGIAGLAAWLALERRARLREGETVLVLGASGAVGQFAVQVARLLGAGRVVAAARDEAGLRRARELGADATVVLDERPTDELADGFREAAGGDVDVVVDPLWGAPAVAALDALGPGGRLVNLGQSAGIEATFSSASVRGKMRSILGHANQLTPPEERRDAYRTLLDHAVAGRMRVEVEVLPLEEISRAWETQASSPHRKIVVRP